MDLNQLINIIKKKISDSINVESIIVEDKTFYTKSTILLEKINFILELRLNLKNLDIKKK